MNAWGAMVAMRRRLSVVLAVLACALFWLVLLLAVGCEDEVDCAGEPGCACAKGDVCDGASVCVAGRCSVSAEDEDGDE